ncbi:DNA polymerase/3'-5' exonuclease PolX [Candidatus Villigracilis affinis]|uniref:DNA polymerase/3'-5' exonuclease PolX n=1 Tax=Candidatus Villigracilis affinis TaxID=3140682 RepID=UPI001DABF1AA|nr:DNA polymerase/3'-5' exonuclease PolX [Anaerolineales bacterium]
MMNNRQLADTFTLIANLCEIKGEVIYVILAYRKASENLMTLGREASEYWKEGKLREIPGVGKAIAEKIDELLTTGKLGFLEKLKEEIPASLADWLQVPGLGPKKIALIWKTLNITALSELETAAKNGQLRDLPGMGAKSETAILEGIASLARRSGRIPLGRAYPLAQEIIKTLKKVKGVVAAEPAGSLRRMRSTVGDLDILVASTNSAAVMEAFINLPGVSRVLGKGETKSSIEFTDGVRAQVWVHAPEKFGTALQYATGSKDHNVQLRQIALAKGLSLSEHSLTKTNGKGEIFCATEEEVYETLGLPWIPPELREDHGEVAAAKAGKLPKLIQVKDIKADLQMHSNWSDGKLTMLEMAQAAIKHGLKVIAFTDHSASLGVTGGLKMEDHKKQAAEIKKIQKQLGDSILILHASEVEIKADGTLDYPDEFLASLDLVLASMHTSLRQPRDKVTQRMINAIRNPHVDIIGHPTGRLIPDREGADLDMEAVLNAAAETGVALEINAHPSRLDLDDMYARRAKELGIPISINTDSHSAEDFDMLFYGVATARRAWLTKDDVINTWSTKKLLDWLKKRGK